jgi:curved DNA-binding protein
VPAGTQSGQVITVRGRGLPSRQPGDLDLKVVVLLPSAHDPRARQLYEQMASVLPDFDARKQHAAAQDAVVDGDAR